MPNPKKRSTRRRSRRQRKVGGAKNVFVLYESGEYLDKSPILISVFETREAARKRVEELIEEMNIDIKASAEGGEFIMEEGDDGMVAYSEFQKGGFYVKEVPYDESK
jgi:hypothetical protein